MKIIEHFKTITAHRLAVMRGCFKVGLYWQGLTHDLSKYSPEEFLVGARYYQGTRSPNNAERESLGYSSAWLHHKGRNKHHYEYWIDYCIQDIPGGMAPARMPVKYVIEMFMDRIAACKIYNGKNYTPKDPLRYYMQRGTEHNMIHPETRALLVRLLKMLAVKGEDYTFAYIRVRLLHKKK